MYGVLLLAAVLILSACFYKLIEQPCMKKEWYKKLPLSVYANFSLSVIRNDALDRFGTPLEQRFSKEEIEKMMLACGLEQIIFSDGHPYWHAVGHKP